MIGLWKGVAVSLQLFLLVGTAAAQDDAKDDAESTAPPEMSLEAVPDAEGNVTLRPKIEDRIEPTLEPYGKTEMPQANGFTDFARDATIQDWFLVRDPQGVVQALYGIDPGAEAAKRLDILEGLGEGSVVEKVSSEDLFAAGFFTEVDAVETIRGTLTAMVNAAVAQVCSFDSRPTQFTMDTSVNVSLGVGGEVKFSMTWDTQELCL